VSDTLEERIDKRCRDLLDLATDPKDLTAALKVVIEFWEKRREPTEAWGSKLNGRGAA
jgi:hypothetical protein